MPTESALVDRLEVSASGPASTKECSLLGMFEYFCDSMDPLTVLQA